MHGINKSSYNKNFDILIGWTQSASLEISIWFINYFAYK